MMGVGMKADREALIRAVFKEGAIRTTYMEGVFKDCGQIRTV
jgi:hypothetical protein